MWSFLYGGARSEDLGSEKSSLAQANKLHVSTRFPKFSSSKYVRKARLCSPDHRLENLVTWGLRKLCVCCKRCLFARAGAYLYLHQTSFVHHACCIMFNVRRSCPILSWTLTVVRLVIFLCKHTPVRLKSYFNSKLTFSLSEFDYVLFSNIHA
jgi:hypothetical protein